RLALLRERDLDDVEVAWHDRVREDRAGLVADLAAAVAGRQVGEREQAHLGLGRQPCRLRRRRMAGLLRAVALLLGERRLVDEQVGLVRRDAELLARRGVARQHDLAARARRAD